MTALFSIAQGMVSQIMSASGLSAMSAAALPDEMIDIIKDVGFLDSIPLWAVTLLGSLFIWVLSLVMILTVYSRFFKLYMATAKVIAELYHRRWGVETSFRSLKYTIGLSNLHGKRDSFVIQELYAALTLFNFASRIVNATVIHKPPGKLYQANFTMAVFLCRNFLQSQTYDGYKLMQLISQYILPVRPGRADKRKLKPKGFVGFVYRIAA